MTALADTLFFRPIIPLLMAMAVGILVGDRFPGQTRWVLGFCIACIAVICLSIRKKKNISITPLLLFASLGYLSLQPWISPRFPTHHIIHFIDSQPWEITGTIDGPPFNDARRTRFVLRAEILARMQRSYPVTGRIQVSVYGRCPELALGTSVSFKSKIRSFRNFRNPGSFDYRKYMMFRKIWGTTYTSAKKLNVLNQPIQKGIRWRIQQIRNRISQRIDNTAKGDASAVLKALVVGDRSGISPGLFEIFHRAGVGHLLAISGLHIGMIATVSFLIFRRLLSHVKPLLWRAWTRRGAALLSLIPVFVYGILAGMSPSTQRAVIMVAVFLFTFLLKRDQDSINTLAIAALIILVVNPPSLFSISFQLSFIAVFSIICGFAWKDEKRHRQISILKITGLKKAFASYAYVSLFAILGTLPLMMRYFNQISLISLFGNLLAIPLIGTIVVPLGLFSVFLYPLSIEASTVGFHVASIVLAFALKLMEVISKPSFAAMKTITPSVLEMSCYYALAWALLNIKKPTHMNRRYATAGAVFVIIVVCVDTGYWLNHRLWHTDLRATIIDVGQGNAALLEIPGGENLLIDGGGFSDNSMFDVGAKVIAPYLWRKKITTIDTLILTHPNSDHLNGLLYIAEHFNVKQIWTNSESRITRGYSQLLEIVNRNGILMPNYASIPRMMNINGVQFEILYPPMDFLARKQKEKWRNTNNNSLVVKVRFGSTSMLFPGDIENEAETELSRLRGDRLKSTLLIAPHHGGRTSSSETFLGKVSPDWVIVSSGLRNRFGFPHPSVINRYEERGCQILNTALRGAISITTDGSSLNITPFTEVK